MPAQRELRGVVVRSAAVVEVGDDAELLVGPQVQRQGRVLDARGEGAGVVDVQLARRRRGVEERRRRRRAQTRRRELSEQGGRDARRAGGAARPVWAAAGAPVLPHREERGDDRVGLSARPSATGPRWLRCAPHA